MDIKFNIESLEREWDLDNGFFGQLWRGELNGASLNRLVESLSVLDFRESETVNRRVVSLLWYMPLFMGWQRERFQESGGDIAEFDKAVNLVENLVERVLGTP
jgi:hypothetical protein